VGGGGGGGLQPLASVGSDNPFAAALTSISLNGGGSAHVPSVAPPPPPAEGSTTSTSAAASSSIASKLTGLVDGFGAWASGSGGDGGKTDDNNDNNYSNKQPPNSYPFEDGVLGEGLAGYGGGGGTRLFHPGDAVGLGCTS
jgi:hypothetical protein